MTSETAELKRERARERKRLSRERKAQNSGTHRLEVDLNHDELAALDRLCAERNPGRPPYARSECIALLILDSAQRLDRQQQLTPRCRNCGNKPPEHCNGAFKGESQCWLTIESLQLNLGVTGHSEEINGV